MGRFGERWMSHEARLAAAWQACIQPEDIVLIPGDVSWAQSTRHVVPDLEWISQLPGRKVLLRGNHDHWWKSFDVAQQMTSPLGLTVVEGSSILVDGVIICGAMGHIAPNDPYYVVDPKKDRFTRELKRLELALQSAYEIRRKAQSKLPILLMLHYPPFTSDGQSTAYVDMINTHKPTLCVYGHLHKSYEWDVARCGLVDGVYYSLVAADYLEMKPRLIWPMEQDIGG